MRKFLALGGTAAAASFLPGVRAFLVLALAATGLSAASVVLLGLSAQLLGLALVAAVGVTVATLHRLKRAGVAQAHDVLRDTGAAAITGGVVAILASVALGVVVPLLISIENVAGFAVFWIACSLSLGFTVGSAWLTGVLQAGDRDRVNLGANIVGTTIAVAGAALAIAIVTDPWACLIAIAIAGLLADGMAWLLRIASARASWTAVELIGDPLAAALQDPLKHLRALPQMAVGAVDGLIMMTTLLVAGAVAASTGPAGGAAILTVAALMRSLILPLKQLGMVAGRLCVSNGEPELRLLRSFTLVVSAALAIAAVALVAAVLLGAFPPEVTPLLAVLLALQLLVEPVAGFLFAAFKIIDRPSFGAARMAGVYFGLAIPILLLLGVLDMATPVWVWTVLLAARTGFGLTLLPGVTRPWNVSSYDSRYDSRRS